MSRRFDIVIFGATGFTGKYAIEVLATSLNQNKTTGITWAVSARSVDKARDALRDVQKLTNIDLTNIEVIHADVNDEKSLVNMTEQAQVVVNVVGPYILHGEAVIKACIETGTHHLDISAEPQFLDGMQIKYHKKAEEAGVLIIGACAFASIPADLGLLLMQDNFPGELAWVESVVQFNKSPQGYPANIGTYDSLITVLAEWRQVMRIQGTLYSLFYEKRTPAYRHKLKRRILPFLPERGSKYCVSFVDTDRWVCQRTQTHNFIKESRRPLQLFSYFAVDSWWEIFGLGLTAPFVLILSQSTFGRRILLNHPRFFTCGNMSKEGPTRQQILETSFQMTFHGKGYKTKLSSPEQEPNKPPGEAKMTLKVSGPDPGYVATATFIIQSAITLIRDRDNIPFKGGVLTPGLAFRKTSLIERLSNHKISFEILP